MRTLLLLFLVVAPICCQNHGDIRLVGGSYPWEGRVEIFLFSQWGTITDPVWTSDDAQVVCRKLGHFKPGTTPHSRAYFGEGSGPIHFSSVECSGIEYSLMDCETSNVIISNSHSFDVGVKCQPADEAYGEGDIRLVGGAYNWEGRVDIYWKGSWGTISDTLWTSQDAIVVCRQLQHYFGSGGAIPCCDVFGEGVGDVHIHDVRCGDSETIITSCTYRNNTGYKTHQHDAGVQCQQGNDNKEGDIRLAGINNYLQYGYIRGRVEIFFSGTWGTVFDDRTGINEAKVVCRQLGYNTHRVDHACCSKLGQGTGPIHLKYPFCNGLEHRLSACQHDTNTAEASHSQDWSVYCYFDGPWPGDVRLSSRYYGYVEVFLSSRWIHITDSGSTWTRNNSHIVCRELGYKNASGWYLSTHHNTVFNQVNNVVCTGAEQKLSNCSFELNSVESDTAVRTTCEIDDCSSGYVRLVGGETEAEGRVEICIDGSGSWGTVCDNHWTDKNAAVVCRHLGFSDIIGDSTYFTSEKFGRGTGPIVMDSVYCRGTEAKLRSCLHFTHYYGCSHSDDVGVHCEPASCSDGQLRLVYGYHGPVKICSNQRWETLKNYRWTPFMARLACIELGFLGYSVWQTNYGRGGGPSHPKYYQCTGTEQRLSQCNNQNDTNLESRSDLGIHCCRADCIYRELRLEGGETEWEGRLEVCSNRRWGTVGNEGWSLVNSQVVCNSLGFDLSESPANTSIPQSLSKPVHFHRVACQNTSLTLHECSYTRYSDDINNITDVIVYCKEPFCRDGDLKLVGGRVPSEGRLQICFNQRWTTINGEGWTYPDAIVACRQLGYTASEFDHYKTIRRSLISLPAIVHKFGCNGTEERLIDCYHHETISGANDYDVGIICVASASMTTSNTGITPSMSIKDATSMVESDSIINATMCYNCASDGASQQSDVLAASTISAVLCFFVFVGLVTGILILVFIRRKRKRRARENKTSGDSSSSNEDGKMSENICYVSSTADHTTSKPQITEADTSTNPRPQKPLPPLPLLPMKGNYDRVDPIIYETCD